MNMHSPVLICGLLVSGILFSSTFLPSFGQGLGFDESNSIIVDGKRVSVTLDMKPVFLTEDDKVGSATIRLREVNTDATVPHVTYHVKIMRASELLVDDRFHSHNGILSLQFEHTDTENEVIGNRESLYNAVIADQQNPALVKGSILVGGLYQYNVTVLSMKEYENKLAEPLNFDLYASVGKTTVYSVLNEAGKNNTLSIKTYYDEINTFDYDSSSLMVTFTMPLTWDVNFISQIPLVHEEVHIPRDFAEIMSNSYVGTVNGVELSNRELMVDDSSFEDVRTVHFMISKERLISIVQKQNPQENIAVFTLTPRDVPRFPLEILSSSENFLLQISWSPALIEPDKSTKFIVTLRDPETLDTFRHASADFVLLKDGKEIFRKHHTAPIGAIVQDYTFSKEQTGTILLLIENINSTGESASLLFTVVPEFPLGPFVGMAVVVSAIIVITRMRSSLNSQHIRN